MTRSAAAGPKKSPAHAVDVLLAIPYLLATMMRRHLITLFALFTGLAALQTTAQANSLQSMVAGASVFASSLEASQTENCSCEADARAKKQQCIDRASKVPFHRLPAALRPPVAVGPDRALE
ncbi:MAG: hypothetical protein AAF697_06090 [Pseudomonadota bacterium]